MTLYNEKQPKNRRVSADFWVMLARILAMGGWLSFIGALVLSFYAAPETQYGYLTYQGIEVRRFWLFPLTQYLYAVLWFSALTSFVCLAIEKYRGRRASDSKAFNQCLLLVIVLAWVVYIFFNMS
jgi:hypothetical protein